MSSTSSPIERRGPHETEGRRSTEHITRVPADIYDEMMQDTPPEPDEALREAAERRRELIHREA